MKIWVINVIDDDEGVHDSIEAFTNIDNAIVKMIRTFEDIFKDVFNEPLSDFTIEHIDEFFYGDLGRYCNFDTQLGDVKIECIKRISDTSTINGVQGFLGMYLITNNFGHIEVNTMSVDLHN